MAAYQRRRSRRSSSGHRAGAGRTSGRTKRSRPIRERIVSGVVRTDVTEPNVVVPVARGVVVAIRRAAGPGIVVPATAPEHPVRASFRCPPHKINGRHADVRHASPVTADRSLPSLREKLSAKPTYAYQLRKLIAIFSSVMRPATYSRNLVRIRFSIRRILLLRHLRYRDTI